MLNYHNNAGGGVALLYASKELDKLPTANFDQKIGVQIIQNALKVWTSILKFYDQNLVTNLLHGILIMGYRQFSIILSHMHELIFC